MPVYQTAAVVEAMAEAMAKVPLANRSRHRSWSPGRRWAVCIEAPGTSMGGTGGTSGASAAAAEATPEEVEATPIGI